MLSILRVSPSLKLLLLSVSATVASGWFNAEGWTSRARRCNPIASLCGPGRFELRLLLGVAGVRRRYPRGCRSNLRHRRPATLDISQQVVPAIALVAVVFSNIEIAANKYRGYS